MTPQLKFDKYCTAMLNNNDDSNTNNSIHISVLQSLWHRRSGYVVNVCHYKSGETVELKHGL